MYASRQRCISLTPALSRRARGIAPHCPVTVVHFWSCLPLTRIYRPHSCRLARRAPSAIDWNLAHTTVGWISDSTLANDEIPQSLLAMTRSRQNLSGSEK